MVLFIAASDPPKVRYLMSSFLWENNIGYHIPLESLKSQDYSWVGGGDKKSNFLDKSGKLTLCEPASHI